MPGFGQAFKNKPTWLTGLPCWAWVFVGGCLLIPVVTLGGAVPAVIGFLGAWGCASIAKQKWFIVGRVICCLLIAIAAWIGTLISAAVLHTAMNRPKTG